MRGPRAGGRDRAPEPYGLDAREFLRKKLIGKEVTVKMEYTRKIGFVPGQEAAPAAPGQEVGMGTKLLLDSRQQEPVAVACQPEAVAPLDMVLRVVRSGHDQHAFHCWTGCCLCFGACLPLETSLSLQWRELAVCALWASGPLHVLWQR